MDCAFYFHARYYGHVSSEGTQMAGPVGLGVGSTWIRCRQHRIGVYTTSGPVVSSSGMLCVGAGRVSHRVNVRVCECAGMPV